jgi:hypothetical protein
MYNPPKLTIKPIKNHWIPYSFTDSDIVDALVRYYEVEADIISVNFKESTVTVEYVIQELHNVKFKTELKWTRVRDVVSIDLFYSQYFMKSYEKY